MRTIPGSFAIPTVLAALVLATTVAPPPAWAAWPLSGQAVCTAPGDQFSVAIAPDGAGGAIIAWIDFRATPVNVFARRILASGEPDPAWPLNGRALRTNPLALAAETESPAFPAITSDGAGGAIVAWQDGRSSVSQTDIYAQHVLGSGEVDPAWPANGTALSTFSGLQDIAQIASDGAGGAIVTWMDGRGVGTASSVDVFAQRVLANGTVDPRWPVNGLPVGAAPGPQEFPVIVEDGTGGALIAWYELRGDPSGFDIYAQHVLGSGVTDPAWPLNGLAVCADPSDQFDATIASDGAHGAIVCWDDNRGFLFRPFAQHVLASGKVDPAWPVNGLAVFEGTVQGDFPQPVPDGAGGAIVTWQVRGATINVHAQHLLVSGVVDPAWPVGGRALGNSGATQTRAAIVPDGAGGAVVAWQENFDDIFAQHVLASGALDSAYPSTGRPICDLPSQQTAPALVETGGGGAIAAWVDTRNGATFDVFALQVLAAGTLDVPAGGPQEISFAQPSPNPANVPLALRFTLPRESRVRLAIFDAAGRRVRELASGVQPAGEHAIAWDLRDQGGRNVAAGLYVARLEVGGLALTRKIVALD